MAARMTDTLARTVPTAPIIEPASPAVMETLALNAHFGPTPAVRDVSLSFPEHEVTAIIGPSGCGKSTLLRCLNRMHETIPLARVDGRSPLEYLDERARRRQRAAALALMDAPPVTMPALVTSWQERLREQDVAD